MKGHLESCCRCSQPGAINQSPNFRMWRTVTSGADFKVVVDEIKAVSQC